MKERSPGRERSDVVCVMKKRLFVNENENYFIRTGILLVSNLSKSIGQYANVTIGSEVSFVKKVLLITSPEEE
ncbi:hypothetical protein ABE273_13915 [Bacillus paranthracis]|nr:MULTISPECIES: hypothetical protein [unclassified Bacillus cereus group]MDA2663680.1 hypothetical protein [Bacillus cereus group sp. Bc032]MDA2674348.1 hypothetical protein [Bacillus cereus group sp. Bc031]MDA2679749.1 hypothetical protein [Bacillus cereus group sp. Bc029]MDA2685286.1 hypothetical protein [Bacillus cereus group sp. Bc030]MDA2740733.1 hypothetical protein [Bacillus cereus group sp. Bc011]